MRAIPGSSIGSRELGSVIIRYGLWFAILGAVGILIGSVVETPNKRLIEALAGVVFVLVALSIHISYAVGVMIALVPFPAGLSIGTSNEVLIFVLLMIHSVKQLARRQPILRRTAIDGPVLILVASMVLSCLNQEGDRKLMMRTMQAFFAAVALCLLITSGCSTREHANRLLAGFLVALTGAALVAVFQILNPGSVLIPEFIYLPERMENIKVVRAAATFGSYSVFGQYMALSMILTSYLFIRTRSPYGKILYMAIIAVCAATFLSAAMRGALFAMAAGLIYLAVIGRDEVKIRDLAVMLITLSGVLIFLAVVMVAYTGTGLLFQRMAGFSLERGSPVKRQETNLLYLGLSLEHPLIGHGPNIRVTAGKGFVTANPHCQYIRYLYTNGILGLAAFVWLLYRLYTYSLRAVRRSDVKDRWIRGLATVFHIMLVVFAGHEMIDDYTDVKHYQQVIWGMFGILVVLSRLVLEETPGTSEPRAAAVPRVSRRIAPLQH